MKTLHYENKLQNKMQTEAETNDKKIVLTLVRRYQAGHVSSIAALASRMSDMLVSCDRRI